MKNFIVAGILENLVKNVVKDEKKADKTVVDILNKSVVDKFQEGGKYIISAYTEKTVSDTAEKAIEIEINKQYGYDKKDVFTVPYIGVESDLKCAIAQYKNAIYNLFETDFGRVYIIKNTAFIPVIIDFNKAMDLIAKIKPAESKQAEKTPTKIPTKKPTKAEKTPTKKGGDEK